MKKEHTNDNKLWTKKRILTDKTKKSLLEDCCCFLKEFVTTDRTNNVYFAKLVLTEKSLYTAQLTLLSALKNYMCVYKWMDEKIYFRIYWYFHYTWQ